MSIIRRFNKIVLLEQNKLSSLILKQLKLSTKHVVHFPVVNRKSYAAIDEKTLIVLQHDSTQYPGQNEWYMKISKNILLTRNTIGILTIPIPDESRWNVQTSAILHNETMSLGRGWQRLRYADRVDRSDRQSIVFNIYAIFHDLESKYPNPFLDDD